MKKGITLLMVATIIALFSFCTEKKADDESCLANDPNPNKSSELAMLMRKMATHTEDLKKQVIAGKLTGTFPEEFRTIHTAKATDAEIKGDAFDGFATAYVKNLETLYSATDDLLPKYNAIVNTCISCHEQSCPGPIVRIKKMIVSN